MTRQPSGIPVRQGGEDVNAPATGERIQSALRHLRDTLEDDSVADLLERMAESASADPSEGALTTDQESVLADAGSLVTSMPPLAERASTLAWQTRTRLLADAYTPAEVAEILGVGDSRVRQHLSRRTLLAVKTSAGPKIPRFQFHHGQILDGWDSVAPHFPPDAHPAAIETFLRTVHEELELAGHLVSPRDWLVSGGSPDTVAALVDDAYLLG